MGEIRKVAFFILLLHHSMTRKSRAAEVEKKSDTILSCAEETVYSRSYGYFRFPETVATEEGTEVRVECPLGFREDGYKPIYEEIATKTTESKKALSGLRRSCVLVNGNEGLRAEWRPALRQTEVGKENYCKVSGWDTAIENWEKQVAAVTPNNFQLLWTRATTLQTHAVMDQDCAIALVEGYASLLTSPQLSGIDAEDRETIFQRLDMFIESLGEALGPGYKVQVESHGIVIDTAVLRGTQFFAKAKLGANGVEEFFSETMEGIKPYETALSPTGFSEFLVGISAEAVLKSMSQTNENPQVKITAYNEDVFKNWEGSPVENSQQASNLCVPTFAKQTHNLKDPNDEDCTLLTNENDTSCDNDSAKEPHETWGLLCIELHGSIKNLTEPIAFTISNTNEEVPDNHQLVCVYWDQDEETWSTNGVTTTVVENGVRCSSTHLTAFSALIEPLPLPVPGAEYAPINNSIHSYILSILSSIGSVCSIVGLFLTLLTFAIFKSLRRERSNRILINLSLSLLLLHIISFSGSRSFWDDHCFVPAASLHYLVLTSLAWMMVEAVHMFELLISVFVRPETRFLIKRIVLAWGIPLIIVAICTTVQPQVYYLGRADLCLMNAHENIILYYGAYIGPVCIMLLVNLIIFIRIFRVFYQQTMRTKAVASQGTAVPKYYLVKISPSQMKGATSVLVLLGIGWILGLLAMGPFEVLFRYLYCICNAGQGLFIFLFRVAFNPQAIKQWKKVLVGFSPDGSLDVSVTTSSTASGKRKLHRKSTILTPTFLSAPSSVENSLTASNPLSTTLANTLAAILKAENERVVGLQKDFK